MLCAAVQFDRPLTLFPGATTDYVAESDKGGEVERLGVGWQKGRLLLDLLMAFVPYRGAR